METAPRNTEAPICPARFLRSNFLLPGISVDSFTSPGSVTWPLVAFSCMIRSCQELHTVYTYVRIIRICINSAKSVQLAMGLQDPHNLRHIIQYCISLPTIDLQQWLTMPDWRKLDTEYDWKEFFRFTCSLHVLRSSSSPSGYHSPSMHFGNNNLLLHMQLKCETF